MGDDLQEDEKVILKAHKGNSAVRKKIKEIIALRSTYEEVRFRAGSNRMICCTG